MQNPTENDRQPDNRAGCAVADGSVPTFISAHDDDLAREYVVKSITLSNQTAIVEIQ